MDNGEVLQGLEEGWSFMGANPMEWIGGFVVFMMINLFSSTPARAMPFMIGGGILTTTTIAALRRSYPDEQRGLRNALLTACGFVPPGIPAPAGLQPEWSACPLRELAATKRFMKLGLDGLFPTHVRDLTPADEVPGGSEREGFVH